MNVSKAATSGQSLNERQFILQALEKDNVRIDGRRPHDLRPIRLHFGRSHGTSHAEVQLGRTRIRTVVTSEIVRPYPDRPVEGFLSFNLDPTRLQESSGGRQDSEARAVALTTIVENGIREARAIDTEALCIVAGDKAWSIHCEIHVLDDGGNLADAACLSTIAALRHFRRPEITVNEGRVIEHSLEDRVPVALSVHHTPIALTYAFIRSSNTSNSATSTSSSSSSNTLQHGDCAVIVDPTDREEMVMDGTMTVVMNLHGELCGVRKIGSPGLPLKRIMECVRRAKIKIHKLSELLKNELKKADEEAKEKLIVFANERRKDVGDAMMMSALRPGEGQQDFGARTVNVIDTLPGLPGSKVEMVEGVGGGGVNGVDEDGDVSMGEGEDSVGGGGRRKEAPLFGGGVTREGRRKGNGNGGGDDGVNGVSSFSVELEEDGRSNSKKMKKNQHLRNQQGDVKEQEEVEEFASMVSKLQAKISSVKVVEGSGDGGVVSSSLKEALKGKAKARTEKSDSKKKKRKKKQKIGK